MRQAMTPDEVREHVKASQDDDSIRDLAVALHRVVPDEQIAARQYDSDAWQAFQAALFEHINRFSARCEAMTDNELAGYLHAEIDGEGPDDPAERHLFNTELSQAASTLEKRYPEASKELTNLSIDESMGQRTRTGPHVRYHVILEAMANRGPHARQHGDRGRDANSYGMFTNTRLASGRSGEIARTPADQHSFAALEMAHQDALRALRETPDDLPATA